MDFYSRWRQGERDKRDQQLNVGESGDPGFVLHHGLVGVHFIIIRERSGGERGERWKKVKKGRRLIIVFRTKYMINSILGT